MSLSSSPGAPSPVIVDEHGPAAAPLVVLVHGSMDRAAGFIRAAHRLERYRVARYDRRGYGRSRPHAGPFGVDEHVQDLVDVLAGRPAVVVGHSFGGVIALALAARRPDLVRAVAAFEPPLPWLDWWPSGTAGGQVAASGDAGPVEPGDVAERFLRRMIGDDTWDLLPNPTQADRRAEGAALLGEITDLHSRVPFAPDTITVPVVLGRGERGPRHHARGVAWLAARIPAADVIVLADAPHGAHLSHPDAFAVEVVDWTVARAAGADPRPRF